GLGERIFITLQKALGLGVAEQLNFLSHCLLGLKSKHCQGTRRRAESAKEPPQVAKGRVTGPRRVAIRQRNLLSSPHLLPSGNLGKCGASVNAAEGFARPPCDLRLIHVPFTGWP